MRNRLTAAAAATAALLLLTACGGDDDSDATPTPEPTTSDSASHEPGDASSTGEDLSLGETYTWEAGLAVTVDNLREVPRAQLGEMEEVAADEIPFVADITIHNGSTEAFDLAALQPNATGAARGGRANAASFEAIGAVGLYEGRLAPGETLETVHGWTIPQDAGREVVIEAFRNDDWNLPMPTWAGTIG